VKLAGDREQRTTVHGSQSGVDQNEEELTGILIGYSSRLVEW
jgi:hypothetical protein